MELTFKIVIRVQQGDPLGPLLFSLSLQASILKLKGKLNSLESEPPEKQELLMFTFYIDDEVIISNHHIFHAVLELFQSSNVIKAGPHLSTTKCKAWWTLHPQRFVQLIYYPDVFQEYVDGTHMLQMPVGSN